MKKLVRFVLLINFMMLINLIVDLIGISFVKGYENYVWGHFYFFDFFYSLIFISIYSIFQIFVFPVHKKYCVYIIPVFTLFFVSFILYNDTDGYGFELVNITVFLVSKITALFICIADTIENDTIRIVFLKFLYRFGYSFYLLAVFSSFKYIMKCISKKYSFFTLNSKQKIKEIDRENQL
jgi:hypothetical protein